MPNKPVLPYRLEGEAPPPPRARRNIQALIDDVLLNAEPGEWWCIPGEFYASHASTLRNRYLGTLDVRTEAVPGTKGYKVSLYVSKVAWS